MDTTIIAGVTSIVSAALGAGATMWMNRRHPDVQKANVISQLEQALSGALESIAKLQERVTKMEITLQAERMNHASELAALQARVEALSEERLANLKEIQHLRAEVARLTAELARLESR